MFRREIATLLFSEFKQSAFGLRGAHNCCIGPDGVVLRLNLFTYPDLTKWIHDPTETSPLQPTAEQLTLPLT